LKCTRHTNVETALTCGRCEKPVCPRCMVHTDVGIRCRDCAPARPLLAGIGSNRLRNIVIIVGGLFIVVVLVGGGAGLSSRGSSDPNLDDYERFIEEELAAYQPDVTVSRLIDPWTSDVAGQAPSGGRRYVALEVTIEYPADRNASHYVSTTNFKLLDSQNFAYSPSESLLDPPLPEALELAPGQRTKGWVMFTIDGGTEIKSISYAMSELSLPRPESNAAGDGNR